MRTLQVASSAAEALAEAEQLEQRFLQLQQRIDAAMQVRCACCRWSPCTLSWQAAWRNYWQPRICLLASVQCELDGRGRNALVPALILVPALQLVPPLPADASAAAGGAAGAAQQAQHSGGSDAMMTDG